MTIAHWKPVPLGVLLTRRREEVVIEDDCRYKRLTIRLEHKGVELRDEVNGTAIGTKRQFRVHEGQFILSKIDARNGAFGVVPCSCEGGVITGNFWTFDPDDSLLDPHFFQYFSRTRGFSDFCIRASSGSTNRRYLQEDRFLMQELLLPPLQEQKQIVSRIEFISTRLSQLEHLSRQVNDATDELCRSLIRTSSTTPQRMSDLVTLREPDVTVSANDNYHFAGVYCFGRGVFVGQQKSGMEFQYPRLTRLRTGDFVYPKLMAWEGALATVPPECDGLVVSTEFPVFSVNCEKVLPEVLDVHFRTPQVWPRLSGASTGTNVRRRRLNPVDFLRYEFPLPPMEVQLQLRRVKSKLDALQSERRSSAREIAAIMPSVLDRAFRGEL